MLQQTGGRQSGRQDTEISIHALQSVAGANAVSGRVRWLETVAERTERVLNQTNQTDHTSRTEPSESLSALVHDARNMVASINLYCELLEEPGVLSSPYRHYAGDLRLVAGAGRRLLEKLGALDLESGGSAALRDSVKPKPTGHSLPQVIPISCHFSGRTSSHRTEPNFYWESCPGESQTSSTAESLAETRRGRIVPDRVPIASLADEIQANRSLISALAGPGISVGLSIAGGNRPIAMTSDDLTRVLVNLASNSAQAMPGGGHIQIALSETADTLQLTFADDGPGIPEARLETVFTPGYTTYIARSSDSAEPDRWLPQHRGLGLAIVRSLVTAAGGMVWASTHAQDAGRETPESGAVFRFVFPVQSSALVQP